jgi:hypothetical protein
MARESLPTDENADPYDYGITRYKAPMASGNQPGGEPECAAR